MSFNLIRNARMFFTTNVDSITGNVRSSGFTPSNTYEIQVLDGLSFSQNTTSETVTLNEAGDTPVRGQQSFNTALDPVEFTFSTYLRPKFMPGSLPDTTDDYITAEERHLWNAIAGVAAIGQTGAAWTETLGASPVSTVSFANSNAHQLQKFGAIIILDSTAYVIDNCALDQATIDFGLEEISTVAWTGRGTKLRSENITATSANPVVFGGTYMTGGSNQAAFKDTTAPYIANKLSTLNVVKGIGGTSTTYNLVLTGGSITIANNLTYLTPANLAIVNQPFTYFTGTRSITGTLNCYLRTGSTNSAGLVDDMLDNSTIDVTPAYKIAVKLGGASNPVRVELEMPAAVLTIPTVNTEQVVSTTINFTAQGYTGSDFNISEANELTVKYYSA
jgi:hypothetical protein